MTKFTVRPIPDGVDMRGSWQLMKSGRRLSTHRKKKAAIRKAYRKASSGDQLEITRLSGTTQDVRTVR